ncbi:MAG: hypothetical protein R3C30_09230 [Hyphomonadaceae bacterium]
MGSLKLNIAFTLFLLALSACATRVSPQQSAHRDVHDRLLYEISVTAPGTRSQGWRGTLYAPDGAPIVLQPGATIDTNVGVFVGVPCQNLWDVCGSVHEETLRWAQEHDANVILGQEPWTYRVFVRAECTRSEAWLGQLVRADQQIAPIGDDLTTAMGPFVAKGGALAFGQHGWFPVSWPSPDPGAGHWPCQERQGLSSTDNPRIGYHASGFDPDFTLQFVGADIIRLVWNDSRDRADFPRPAPILPAWNGEIYNTRNTDHTLRIEIRHVPCRSSAQASARSDSVVVTIDGRRLQGCGAPT